MPRRAIKFLSLLLCFLLIFQQSGFAQVAGELDISGHFLQLRNSLIQDKFRPLHLRYLSYDNLNNNFRLLLDKGDFNKGLSPEGTDPKEKLKEQTKTLLNYFFIGISLPNDSFWVNLRPDSPDDVIDPLLATTDVGKILLEADLQLKKDTAQATSPETPEGKDYWNKLYKKAEELFGTENITIPTLTRPWIVPGEIIIRETLENAYIYKATLKVMLEQDYLKGSSAYSFKDERLKALNEYSSQLIRELIIPKLTKEVNNAKRYAALRQVYYSLILAQWFKARFYGKSGLYSWLIDKNNLNGLTSKTPYTPNAYFAQYKKSFAEGEYNFKEQVYTPFGQTIRSYMSGGIMLIPEGGMPPLAKTGEVSHSTASPVTTVGGSLKKGAPLSRDTLGFTVTGGSNLDNLLEGVSLKPEKDRQITSPQKTEPAIKPQEIKEETSSPLAGKEDLGQCVTADTLLRLADGRQVPIVEVKAGDYALSLNEETQQIEPRRIKGLLDMGVKQVYRITTQSGKTLKTTLNHPYLTKSGWMKLKDIKKGEEILVAENLFRPDSDFVSFHDKKFSFELGWRKFLEEIKGILNNFFLTHIFNINNCYAQGGFYIEAQDIAKIPVKSKQDTFVLQGITKDIAIRGNSEVCLIGRDDLQSVLPERNDNISVNALVGKDNHRQSLSLRDCLGRVFHKLRGIFNGSNNIFFGNAGILPGDIIQGVSRSNEIEDVVYSNARSSNTGLAKSNIRVNHNSVFIHNPNSFILKDNIVTESSQDDLKIAFEPIVSIEYLGKKHVYDIEVEGTHNFIANGIFAHNTYIKGAASPIAKSGKSAASPLEERASPTMSDWARGRRKTLWGIAGTLATLGLPGVPGADIGIVETPQLPKVTSEQINIQNIINRARAGDKEAFHILGQLALQDNRGALNALVELADKGSAEALGELIQLVKGDGQNVAVQREIKQRLNGFNPSPFVGEAKKGALPVIKLLYELVMDFENTAAAYALLEVANAAPERVAREEATRWLWMLAKNKGRESIAALLMRDINPQPILEEIASMLTEMQSPTALGHANLNRVLNLIRLLLSLAEYDNISAEVSLPGIVVDNLVNRQGVDDAALLATLAVLVKHGNPSAVNLIETLVKNGVKEALFSLISLGEIETERIKELDISRLEVLAEAGNKDAKYILSQLAQWDNEGAAEAVRKLNLDKPSPTDKAQPPVGSSPIADKKGGIDASTPLSIDSREVGKGGIDFRGLPIVTQPMGSSPLGTVPLAGQVKPLAGRVPVAHLDAEWREIENMLNAGIIPSTERIKEYLQSCCQEKNFPQEIDKVLSCLADILRLEEERVSSTEPALKEILVLLESDKPMEEFQPGLSKISVEPKEPKLLEQ